MAKNILVNLQRINVTVTESSSGRTAVSTTVNGSKASSMGSVYTEMPTEKTAAESGRTERGRDGSIDYLYKFRSI